MGLVLETRLVAGGPILTTARCELSIGLLLGWRGELEARVGAWPFTVSCFTPIVAPGGDKTEPLVSALRDGMMPSKPVPPKGFLDGGRGEDLSPFAVPWPLIPALT